MEPLEFVGVVAEIIGTVWGILIGSKTLRDLAKSLRRQRVQEETPSPKASQVTAPSEHEYTHPPGTPGYLFGVDVMRLDELVGRVKNLVSSIEYEGAVSTAKEYRERMMDIGDQSNPAFQLALAELDIWYAHAQIYTGHTVEAILRLREVITSLQGQRQRFAPLPFGKRRWNHVLGRAHNHVGYACWMDRGNYEVALKEFGIAISHFFTEKSLEAELATAYDNMGRVYAQLGYQTRAELLIEHGRRIREGLKDDYRYALSLNSKAISQLAFGQPYRAFLTSEEARKIFEQQERGIRGIGLALLTQGRAHRYLGAYWRHSQSRDGFRGHLQKAIEALKKAEDKFLSVGEDIRLFQACNELGCTYRELVALDKSDTESAKQAQHYLKKSEEAAPKEKYPSLYVDTCEDLARLYFMLDQRKEAQNYLRKAEKAIPGDYKLKRKSQFCVISSADRVEEHWQQLAKIQGLRGEMALDRSRPPTKRAELRRVIEHYLLASCYFGVFLKRPLDPALEPMGRQLYPLCQPRLTSHRLFVEHLYSCLSSLSPDDLCLIGETLLPEFERVYSLQPAWLDVFQEALDLLWHAKAAAPA